MIKLQFPNVACRMHLSEEEMQALRSAFTTSKTIAARSCIARAGEALTSCSVLLSGWIGRAKHLRNGERQFALVNFPGDFVDLGGIPLRRLDHDLISFTSCELAMATHDSLRRLLERWPNIRQLFWLMTSIDESIICEHDLSVGRRDALQRLAHLMCELHVRLSIVSLVHNGCFRLPLTQPDLADCTGMTAVHANRSLMRLRQEKLIGFDCRNMCIPDFERLARVAGFNPAFLHITPPQQQTDWRPLRRIQMPDSRPTAERLAAG